MTRGVDPLAKAKQQVPEYDFVELICQGTRTAVYRAVETATQRSVVIKVLSQEYPSLAELLQFRNQYVVTKNLAIAQIVHPLRLVPYGNGYGLVMEDDGGISLQQYAQQRPPDLTTILHIALQLAGILHELHQHRVIHKDLKPANILIHPGTQHIKLIDFSVASLLPKEIQEIQSPSTLEGTLAYMAPEQTGRMNRGIDYRADFYALGVTLYQLLTGQLPFTSDDPLELIHCHMAQRPVAVEQLNPAIPTMVGALVAKLMAKNAEDRYQSALGLKSDLEQCWMQWRDRGEIADFALGQRDISDRFTIPEQLYGREPEVGALLAAFDRASQGTSELLLVAGFSGIGKTAVINEVHKPIVRQRGYFIKGKFDQFNRQVPFSAFVQACRDLIDQLLAESDAQLAAWKVQILDALGENAQVIIELIPELERLIGPQAPAPELSGTAAQNRFNLLFQRFIEVFTTRDHPLVIFLDDLQWADSASLHLIQVLMAEGQAQCLLLLGAYRDNEVFTAHPLMLTLDEIAKAGASCQTLTLQPLTFSSLNHLIADTLHIPAAGVHPLTEQVMQQTQGNPFFATQLLKALHQDQLIRFDYDAGHWQFGTVPIRKNDDVVEFLVQELQKLPAATQAGLQLAACIGNQFDLETLAVVSEQSMMEAAIALWPALQEHFIVPTNQTYKLFQAGETVEAEVAALANPGYQFFHDRVQQAAYSLIPPAQKQATHLHIGRLLWANTTAEQLSDRLFEIVGHFNAGLELITQLPERLQLAELNVTAGHKARVSTAYDTALKYCDYAEQLLPTDCWQRHSQLTRRLYEERTEAAFCVGDFAQMNAAIDLILQNSSNVLEQVRLYELKIKALLVQGETLSAISLGREILRELGVTLPETVTPDDIYQVVETTLADLGERSVEDLASLPEMDDPKMLAALSIMAGLGPPIFMAAPQLFPALASKTVKLFLEQGNCPLSAPGYADFGIVVSSVLHQLEVGYQFGQLALKMLDQFPLKAAQPMALLKVAAFTYFNRQPMKDAIALLQNAYLAAGETGDVVHISASAQFTVLYLTISGTATLDTIADTIQSYQPSLVSSQFLIRTVNVIQQTLENLVQVTAHPATLVGEFCDETQLLPALREEKEATILHILFLCKAMLAYTFGHSQAALDASIQGEAHLQGGTGMATIPFFHYYYALALLAVEATADPAQQVELRSQVEIHQRQLQLRAQAAPMNFQHLAGLVEAECQRVSGNISAAIEAYDCAIASAKDSGFIRDQALANELAAQFYLQWGKPKVAASYLQEAYYCYARWGAQAKVTDLETRYPDLLRPILQAPAPINGGWQPLSSMALSLPSERSLTPDNSRHPSIHQTFDFVSILKASQAISSTIQLEDLLHQLSQIILQNSGADRCVLILPNFEGSWQIRAIATLTGTDLCTLPLADQTVLPMKLIQYVKHQQKVMVINDCTSDRCQLMDSYPEGGHPKSILCLPLLHQGQLNGIIYFANQLSTGVFSRDRITTLELICTQAAISLNNAQLYEQLKQSELHLEQQVKERTQALEVANQELERIASVDALTQVANRRCFDQHLQREWQCHLRHQEPLSLLLIDVDYFKNYNDYYGHQVGDTCLTQVAQALAAVTQRSTDLFARYGGEEFAAILVRTSLQESLHVAELMQSAIANLAIPHATSPVKSTITVSMGVLSIVPTSENSIETAIAQADQLLYRAKKAGRNQYMSYQGNGLLTED